MNLLLKKKKRLKPTSKLNLRILSLFQCIPDSGPPPPRLCSPRDIIDVNMLKALRIPCVNKLA